MEKDCRNIHHKYTFKCKHLAVAFTCGMVSRGGSTRHDGGGLCGGCSMSTGANDPIGTLAEMSPNTTGPARGLRPFRELTEEGSKYDGCFASKDDGVEGVDGIWLGNGES
eukprot:scaffold233971_cov46-Prasinocladus_malaysianus.AAC.3